MSDDKMETSVDASGADAEADEGLGRGRGRGRGQPPLPPGSPPGDAGDLRHRLRGGGRGGRGASRPDRGHGDRGHGGRGGFARPGRAPTLPGWAPSGNVREDGKDTFAGTCEGCGCACEVPFRPVKGGNPPVCEACHQSLRAAQDQSVGGPDRGARTRARYDPYGDPRAMAAMQMQMRMHAQMFARGAPGRGRGRGRGSNVWTPDADADADARMGGGDPEPGRAPSSRKPLASKTWTREGAGERGSSAEKPPCSFFARGRCSKGDACLFSHAAGVQGDEAPPDQDEAMA